MHYGSGSCSRVVITAGAGAGGSISPSGQLTVTIGSNQTFIITADPGYQVADVLVDGRSVSTISTYTFSNVTAGHNNN